MRIRFTPAALSDLDAALAYIRERSPQGAKRVRNRVLSTIKRLRKFPGIGTPTDHDKTRMLVATPYPNLVFYEIDDHAGEVIILHIRHGARDRNE